MKKSIKLLSTLVVSLFLFTLAPTSTASANSAQHFWRGYTSTGLMITDEECPIEVENENLVFNIDSFPQISINGETLKSSTVTAEYTFYNPADYTVEASLAFPFGHYPSYGYNYNRETGEYEMLEEDFLVSVDGEEIEKSIRHTISYNNYRYDNDVDLPKLVDGLAKDDFYSPDLPVYEYKFSLNCTEREDPPKHSFDAGFFYTSFRWKKKEGVRLFYDKDSSYKTKKTDDYFEIVLRFKSKTEINLYFIGGQPEIQPSWTFYNSSELKDENEVVGTANLISVNEIDFYSLLMKPYKEEYGVSESDWYNALMFDFKESYDANIGRVNASSRGLFRGVAYFLMSENLLMRWCYYSITLQPKQRIVNAVTVPLYPDKDISYTPEIYTYHYLLSPAKTWKSFKNLNIKIVTPYELVNSDGFNFVKHPTQNEYNLSLSGLPDGELSFVLSTEKEPVYRSKRRGCFSSLNQGGILLSFLLITTACFYVFKNKKR